MNLPGWRVMLCMLGASADHFGHTVHMGVQVSVVDNDIFNYFLDVVSAGQRFVSMTVVFVASRDKAHDIAPKREVPQGVMNVVSLELSASKGICQYP